MNIVIFHNPNCGTSRNVVQIVKDAGFSPTVVEYLDTGWTKPQLQTLFATAGLSARDALRMSKSPAQELGLMGSIGGLVLVHTIFGMPILTLLFRNYFASIPQELFKAARVDGAGFWQIYFQIMIPMALPIFVVAIILQVTGIWNDFLFGVIYTKPETYPMTVQLNNIVNSVQGIKEYNVNMAATLLTGLVPLIIYFASGKLFVRGIAAGAVKG